MKTFSANLQAATQTSYSNNGITTILGRAVQKTINSQSVIGPPLTQFIDTFTILGLTPSFTYFNPVTGHLFVLSSVSASPTIALFTISAAGVAAYVGKIIVTLANTAATTHVLRGFRVYESGGTIHALISTTGSVVINGGTFVAYGMSTADFTIGGTTIWAAQSTGAKGVYFLQDSGALGVNHVASASWGIALPQFSASGSFNTKVYQFNGTLALPVVYSWDLATSPAVANTTTGVNAQTTLYAGTSPSAFFTSSTTNPNLSANDPVIITGTAPTGFTASTGTAAQTVYFIRDIQLISGSYYFNLAATSAGAAITPTGAASGFTIMRAFGTSSNGFSFKTGTLPAFAGVLVQLNTIEYAKPVSVPANTALNGQDCLSLATSTTLYLGKLSDLSSNGTNWASITGVNITGTGIDIVAPTVALASYSGQGQTTDVDRWVYVTNTASFVMKAQMASAITATFGGTANAWFETLNPVTVQPSVETITGIDCKGGWLFVASTTAGQRGVVVLDMYSDSNFSNSAVISPVLSVPPGTTFSVITSLLQLPYLTNRPNYFIRSAATSTDASFSSATGGWTQISPNANLSATAIGPYFQLMGTYATMTGVGTPAQINDFVYSCLPPGEQSDYWAVDNDFTTQTPGSPSYAAWYLQKTYASTVPTLYARVYDTSGNLIFSANTSANPTAFSYSTNGGTSWTSLGTIPNTATTLVRVLVTPTPAVIAYVSVRES